MTSLSYVTEEWKWLFLLHESLHVCQDLYFVTVVCWEAGMMLWRNEARMQENEVPVRRVWNLMAAGWPSKLCELTGLLW